MMPTLRSYLYLAVALLLALSCESEVREANVNQDKYIDDYVSSNFADCPVYHTGGVTRVVLQEGVAGGPVIEPGDSVYIYYVGYVFAQNGPGNGFVTDSGMVRVGAGKLIRGLEEGLPGARLGEDALILFSADDGYGNQAVGLVPENSALLFEVGVGAIKKN